VGQALGGADAEAAQPELAFIYALTPQGRVIELPAGSTAVDFAYHVHTGLGHRCRGARVDGQLMPLNRPLQSGQTVEIVAAKEGSAEGPSRDWLNPSLGYVASPRARGKVRQWFNALELARDAAGGRERIERVLQREGSTALSFEELARRLAEPDPMAMFVAVAREEIGPRQLEDAIRGAGDVAASETEPELLQRLTRQGASASPQRAGSVLVVGMDSLMNQLARCCRPLPPDPVSGFVTRGRGVSVHRTNCPTFSRLAREAPERVIDTSWDPRALKVGAGSDQRRFSVEIELRANDRQGLLRDVSDVFARDRLNVTAVNTLSRQQQALMRFTIEASDAAQLERTLVALRRVAGVVDARRRMS
jgi:GTP pyrophosphokinase